MFFRCLAGFIAFYWVLVGLLYGFSPGLGRFLFFTFVFFCRGGQPSGGLSWLRYLLFFYLLFFGCILLGGVIAERI